MYNYLRTKNIETRKGFYSADRIEIFKLRKKFLNSNFLSKNIICLPLHLNLKNKDIKFISKEINKFIN